MSVAFRCKCGRWIRATDDAPVDRCPHCLRAVYRTPVGLLWWVGGGLAAVVAVGLLVLSVLPRQAVAEVAVAQPTFQMLTPAVTSTPTTAARTEPTLPTPPETLPPPRPEPPSPPAPPPKAPEPPRVGKLVVEPAGKYKEGDTFVQTVTVSRVSAFGVLGVVTTQGAEYTLASRLEVTKVNADGSFVVTQTVQTGKLIDATPDMKEPLADALKKAEGAKFELTVAQNGKVTALKGLNDPVNVKLGRNVEQQTLRLWSILDADAWKELAGMTFFQPDQPGLGEKWNRDFAHDWGPLGSWLGRTDYLTAKNPEKDGQHKIDYAHAISHRPAKAAGNLPIAIKEAAFPRVIAGGTIRYDAKTNRATAAEEVFHVRGVVGVSFGGADAAVEVEERQKFRVTASEVKARELIGEAPKK